MQYIADIVGKHITEDVDHIVVDGACAGAIKIHTQEHPRLSRGICTTHSMDLMMKDLGSIDSAAYTVSSARDLVKFVMNHWKPRVK